MSFSSDIKQELNKTSNLANKELVKYELVRVSNYKKYRHLLQLSAIINAEGAVRGKRSRTLFSAVSGGTACREEENSAQEQEYIPPLSRGIFYMKKARQPPRLFRILYCRA